jgi:hypothetical protein
MTFLNIYKKNLIKLLLKNKIKPDLSNYTYNELYDMYIKFNEDKNNYLSILKYPENTINIINDICNNSKFIENNLMDFNKKIIIDKIDNLWKKLPLLNSNRELINCAICLEIITNSNYIYFVCEHITHSSCFLNYLFYNLKNNNNDFIKLFRCPNCRNYLTDNILKYSNKDNSVNNSTNNYIEILGENYSDIVQEYGDESNNFILQEFNLIENCINNNSVNNLFRTFNTNNRITSNIDINLIPNIVVINNYDNDHDSLESSDIESIDDNSSTLSINYKI